MTIDMQVFCLRPDECIRWALDKPFVQSGWKYATNGRVAIRVPTLEADTVLLAGHFPAAHRVFYGLIDFWDERRSSFPPHDGTITGDKCLFCDGTKKELIECPCYELDEESFCKACKNTFNIPSGNPCCYCNESGMQWTNNRVCGGIVLAHYQRIIADLPGAQCFTFYSINEYEYKPIPFVFADGGQGVLMAILPK